MGGSTWSRISFAFWAAAIWQASAALGREVSRSVVACRTTRSSPLVHREMSLGSHGNDREVDRAQHLFCHRANEQLAELAPAPCPEQHAVGLKLADGGCNLLCGVALAHQRVATDAAPGGDFTPGPQHLFRDLQSAYSVVVRHSGSIGGDGARKRRGHARRISRAPVSPACSRANGMRWSRSLKSVATRIVAGCVQRPVSESRMANTSYPKAWHWPGGRDVPGRTTNCDLDHVAPRRNGPKTRFRIALDAAAPTRLHACRKWPDRLY